MKSYPMTNLDQILKDTHAAAEDLICAAESAEDRWTVPRAPGKWSPSQVVEHVARALEESAHVVAGQPSKFPTFPAPLRFVARALFFQRVLKNDKFPKARTTKPLNPLTGPATPQLGRVRIEAAVAEFDTQCRARAASGRNVESTIFGTVSVEDYARFQKIHTRHHRQQITTGEVRLPRR